MSDKKPAKKSTKKPAAPKKGRPAQMTDDKAIETAIRVILKYERQPSDKAARDFLLACGAKRYLALHRYALEQE